MLPPENACGDITDENSGDENVLTIENLPANQLRAPVEVIINNTANPEEYIMPLSEIAKLLSKKSTEVFKCKKTSNGHKKILK